MGQKASQKCQVLTPEHFLEHKNFNIWNCFSEHKSDFNGRLHFHDFFELSVIYEGTSRFLVNGFEYNMGVKSLQLIRPKDYHRQLTGDGEYIRYYNLMFSPNYLTEDLQKILEEYSAPLCANASEEDWNSILNSLNLIEEEFHQNGKDPLSQIFIRTNVENLCVYILRHQQSCDIPHVETVQEPIRRAFNFIRQNYRREFRLSDVAKAVGLSPSYFSALFHSTMGITFSHYLTNYRLRIAERYLQTSDLSVKQIASVCGFTSYPYFVTAFKTEYGASPGAYRNQKGVTENE